MTRSKYPVKNMRLHHHNYEGVCVQIIQWKKQISGIVVGILVIGTITSSTIAFAEPQTESKNEDEQCSKDILLAYFPDIFVRETLRNYEVPKDQWEAIISELTIKDRDIIKQVEAKAEKLNPNPLKDPQQRQAAVKIFRDTLLENFSAILKAHDIKDEKQIQAMLDDIQQQKAKRFAKCMESQRAPREAPSDKDKQLKE